MKLPRQKDEIAYEIAQAKAMKSHMKLPRQSNEIAYEIAQTKQ